MDTGSREENVKTRIWSPSLLLSVAHGQWREQGNRSIRIQWQVTGVIAGLCRRVGLPLAGISQSP
ncbi:MAG: hypothetical protein KGK16_12745, partial [Bradyrhizobium sp.]|nr:hypothetical protein [Bradyrhizobium sp.]